MTAIIQRTTPIFASKKWLRAEIAHSLQVSWRWKSWKLKSSGYLRTLFIRRNADLVKDQTQLTWWTHLLNTQEDSTLTVTWSRCPFRNSILHLIFALSSGLLGCCKLTTLVVSGSGYNCPVHTTGIVDQNKITSLRSPAGKEYKLEYPYAKKAPKMVTGLLEIREAHPHQQLSFSDLRPQSTTRDMTKSIQAKNTNYLNVKEQHSCSMRKKLSESMASVDDATEHITQRQGSLPA